MFFAYYYNIFNKLLYFQDVTLPIEYLFNKSIIIILSINKFNKKKLLKSILYAKFNGEIHLNSLSKKVLVSLLMEYIIRQI